MVTSGRSRTPKRCHSAFHCKQSVFRSRLSSVGGSTQRWPRPHFGIQIFYHQRGARYG